MTSIQGIIWGLSSKIAKAQNPSITNGAPSNLFPILPIPSIRILQKSYSTGYSDVLTYLSESSIYVIFFPPTISGVF